MKQNYKYIPLAMRVLAVAVINTHDEKVFDWAAYIDAVPGQNHENEYLNVAENGSKTSKEIAEVLFPDLEIERYRE